jgi:acetyl esterase/lipase
MGSTTGRTGPRTLAAIALTVTPLLAGSADAQAPAATPYAITAVDTAHGDRAFHLLWPDGAPGALGSEAVDKPKITVYLAPADRATGAAVVICPGGGYRVVAADHEGKQVAEWLNSLGVSAFVLQYRLGERYRHPAPLQDAQRAIRMVRSRAKEWRVDPKRIGILGFSAGGHLASSAATHFDDGRKDASDPIEREGSRPDFAVLCYAVISLVDPPAHSGSRRHLLGDPPDPALVELLSNERQVTARTPPTFLWHTADDGAVPVENSLLFFQALRKAGVAGELHVFPHGKHGLGLAPGDPSVSQWPGLCAVWMEGLGLLKKQP